MAVEEEHPAELIEAYYERGWTDGLPVVPPSDESIAAMLAGAALTGDETIGEIEERGVVVSADKLAINAVMAGCRPEYLPVVLAAWDAFLGDGMVTRSIWQSTTGTAPFSVLFVNRFHGAATRVDPAATAFAQRAAHQVVEVIAVWPPDDSPGRHRAWADSVVEALDPVALPGVLLARLIETTVAEPVLAVAVVPPAPVVRVTLATVVTVGPGVTVAVFPPPLLAITAMMAIAAKSQALIAAGSSARARSHRACDRDRAASAGGSGLCRSYRR